MTKQTLDDYLEALERMKRSPRDRVGVLGELGVTGIGVAGGLAASGTIAGAFGATTILGSTTLGSLLGGVFVATTPVGWFIGSALAGGALAFGAARLVSNGSRFETLKKLDIAELEQRIEKLRQSADRSPLRQKKMREVITGVQYLVANGRLTQSKATDLLAAIQKKHLSIDDAFQQIRAFVHDEREIGTALAERRQPAGKANQRLLRRLQRPKRGGDAR